jgi:hypothetical protein
VDLSGQSSVSAQDEVAEVFVYEFDSSTGNALSSDAQVVITGFDPSEDILRFDDAADPAISESAFLDGAASGGAIITIDSFGSDAGTNINFGDDPALPGNTPGSVGIIGQFEADLANASGAFFEVV